MAEQVIQSGSLGEPALLDLLMAAQRSPFPVILHVARNEQHERSLWFRQGRLVGFDTSLAGESLGAMLVKRGKLQPETAQDVRRSASAESSSDAAIIQRLRLLSTPILAREMSLWATLLLVQTFAWETGTFRLVAEASGAAPPLVLLDVNLAAAIKSGVTRKLSVERARADLAEIAGVAPVPADDPPIGLDAFGLPADHAAFLEGLDGTRTIGDLLESPPLEPGDTARLLYLAQHAELVRLQAPVGAAAGPDDDFDLGDALDDLDLDDGFGAVAPDSRPPPVPEAGAIDFSQISFGASRGSGRSRTTHTSTRGEREEVAKTFGRARVQVVTGSVDARDASLPDPPAADTSSSGLGSDLFKGFADSSRAKVSAPRGGKPRAPGQGPSSGPPTNPRGPAIDLPPEGPGFTIEPAEWARLTTKEKNRIKELATRLNDMESQNYFQWLDLPDEAPLMSVKKAFFKMAQRFHPDKMIDESEVYARLAEILFTKVSEAYETLGDEESSTAYVKKHIYGEKDENDLAMEKVQEILKAEGEFKRGQRMLNAGKLVGALTAFEAAVKGYPEEGEYLAHLGYTIVRVKPKDADEVERALELLHKGIEMAPASPVPNHLLGKSHLLLGDASAAKKALRASLKMNADNPEAVRDYKRADAIEKGESVDGRPDDKKSGLKGLFGRFKKSK